MKRCMSDELLVIPLGELRTDDKLHFVEELVEVMDREIKQLKRSRIPIIKVRWNSKRGPEFTWEREDSSLHKSGVFIHYNVLSLKDKAHLTGGDIFTPSVIVTIIITGGPPLVNEARVMSSASSMVTYTSVDTDSEPGRAFWPADEELSDEGSPRVIVYGNDGFPIQPHVFPAEEQLLPPVDSPTAMSPGYVADSDPEEDLEEDSEEEHADYPADGGDDDDDDEDDDDTDDEDKEPFKEEEEEHLAPVDPSDVPVLSAEDIEALEADEPIPTLPSPPAYRITARISIRPEAPILFPPEEEVERLLALPTPPPSPLISLSPPSAKECLARCLATPALPSSPLPILPHPYGSPNHVRAPPGFRATIGRLRASSSLPLLVPAALPLPSPPLPLRILLIVSFWESEWLTLLLLTMLGTLGVNMAWLNQCLTYLPRYSPSNLALWMGNPDVNLWKKDVGNVLVWVKLHVVLVTAFSEDDLSVIAIKLGNPLMFDSYTSNMCLQSWGMSSYARAMIELQADVELKDTIVVAMPKLTGRGFIREEYPKNPSLGVAKSSKKPSQAPSGVSVGPKVGFKPLPSSPLPPLPDSLFIPPVDRREDIPEAELPPHKRLCLTTPASRYVVGESSTAVPRPTRGRRIDYGFVGTLDDRACSRRQRAEAVGYRIRDTWVDPRETAEEVAPVTLEGVNTRDRQTQIHQTFEALVDDRQYHYETARLLDQEVLVSQEAWAHSMGFSLAVHYELQGYRAHVWTQDHRMDVQDSLIAALTAQVSSLQGHLATALGEI
ncbi:hypothetical protein Tco_0596346 [Tanacetum coccineum]